MKSRNATRSPSDRRNPLLTPDKNRAPIMDAEPALHHRSSRPTQNDKRSLQQEGEPINNGVENDGLMVTSTGDHNRESNSSSTIKTVADEGNSDFWQTVAGVAGNVLEWYDFAVFGYFSDVLGEVFFPPNQSGDNATTESFLVFGGAFLMRPIGGLLLGYVGDMYGRKKALVISIFLMAFPTFAMGCLPSYERIGDWAIVLLVLVRLLQGLSVGGQLMSSLVFTLENHDPSKWGLYGSFVMAAANFGTLLGGIAGFVIRALLSEEQLRVWGWRLPFVSGIFVSISGFYLKSHGGDHDGHHYHPPGENLPVQEDTDEITAPPQNPLVQAFSRGNIRSLLASSMVPMLWSAGFYLSFVWMAIFMSDLIDDPVPGAFAVNSAALLVSVCLLFPLAGILSDRFGRRRIMTIGGVGMGVLSPILVILIGKGKPVLAFFAQSIMGISLSCWGAPMCAWLVESFEPDARLTSVSFGYNLAHAIAGGITPFLATVLVDKVGSWSPGCILTALSVISLTGLLCVAPSPSTSGSIGQSKDFQSIATEATTMGGGRETEVEMVGAPQAADEDDGDDDELL